MKFIKKHWLRVLLDSCTILAFVCGDIIISTNPRAQLFNSLCTVALTAVLSWDTCTLYNREQKQEMDNDKSKKSNCNLE